MFQLLFGMHQNYVIAMRNPKRMNRQQQHLWDVCIRICTSNKWNSFNENKLLSVHKMHSSTFGFNRNLLAFERVIVLHCFHRKTVRKLQMKKKKKNESVTIFQQKKWTVPKVALCNWVECILFKWKMCAPQKRINTRMELCLYWGEMGLLKTNTKQKFMAFLWATIPKFNCCIKNENIRLLIHLHSMLFRNVKTLFVAQSCAFH